jgi:hypothetical protein
MPKGLSRYDFALWYALTQKNNFSYAYNLFRVDKTN